MLLFRIEHPTDPDRCGPYNGPEWPNQWVMASDHRDDDHPHPLVDPQLGMCKRGVEFCACDSPASLLDWFEGWFEELHAAGYEVVIIEVGEDDARVGYAGQALFDRSASTVVEHLPIPMFTDLFADTHVDDLVPA